MQIIKYYYCIGPTQISVQWTAPIVLNGLLERYLVYSSTVLGSAGLLSYNSSDLFTNTILYNLIPGTTYYISVAVGLYCVAL